MRSLVAILIAFLSSTFSPASVGEPSFPHASANISYDSKIPAAVLELQTKEESAELTYDSLCNISAFSDFFGNPREVIISALRDIPCSLVQGLENVVVFDDPKKPRALASASSLHLRYDTLDLLEARQVLIHELAHIADLSGINSISYSEVSAFRDGNTPIYRDDVSARFYSISWEQNSSWSEETKKTDFVSGYAATDPFEDFAESFLFYIDHGNAFLALGKQYPQLQEKYDFLRDKVFGGKEFFTGTVPKDLSVREWDATKIEW